MTADDDMIRRGDALAAIQLGETVTKMQARIAAIPAVGADPVCTCCGGTGITYQTERRCACQPAPEPRDVRAAALAEACGKLHDLMCLPDGADLAIAKRWAAEARALILGAKPPKDPRSANRVTYDDKGNLDEIVTDAGIHLEDLGGNRWFLGAARSDGTEIRVWFLGKVTMIEDDFKEPSA